jgi:hypothetical protein
MQASVLLNNILLLVASVFITLTFSIPAEAFGQLGHRIIGQIAQDNLTQKAQQKINRLTQGKTLAQVSTWADEIRSNKAWVRAAPWHYISIEDDQTWKTVKRSPDGDIINSLQRFEQVLKTPKASQQAKWQALAFYVHFVGDIHQPLHVGHHHDKGGNTVKLKWFGEETNLHTVWDRKMIEHQQLSYTEYSVFLSHISDKQRQQWTGKNYYQWADESKALRGSAYQLEQNDQGEDDLRFHYVFINKHIIEQRLQQAGSRLAEKLNRIFG